MRPAALGPHQNSRMTVLHRVIVALLLAALGTNAEPSAELCPHLPQKLPTRDLDNKVRGNWTLIWAIADYDDGNDMLKLLNNSHIELDFHTHDDHTDFTYDERNMFRNKSCSYYWMKTNMSVSSSEDSLNFEGGLEETEGNVTQFEMLSTVEFYEICPQMCSNCMMIVFNWAPGRFLLSYKREGKLGDADELQKSQSYSKHHAEHLGINAEKAFSHGGEADVCQKKPTPAVGLQHA